MLIALQILRQLNFNVSNQRKNLFSSKSFIFPTFYERFIIQKQVAVIGKKKICLVLMGVGRKLRTAKLYLVDVVDHVSYSWYMLLFFNCEFHCGI